MAQKQNYIWYFGKGAGLDFNENCEPAVLTNGKIDGFEGCATMSDKETGQLLFYTNSDSVWNRYHQVMPGGHLVTGGSTITQVLILPKPGSSSVYYIITSDVQATTGIGLQYHEVDMDLNNGLGGIASKNNGIWPSPMTEKITAIKHANGTDIWLIAHEYNSDKFLSFLVTAAGINTSPVVTQIGKTYTSGTGPMSTVRAVGEIKASPDGSKLAAVSFGLPDVELLHFNKATGVLSDLITLPEQGHYDELGNPSGLYGVAFSANSNFLYVSRHNFPGTGVQGMVIQYNVGFKDSASVSESREEVFTTTGKSMFSLQLAPNRKIYVGQNYSGYLSVIHAPDSAGAACRYEDDGLYLNGKLSGWGLNNLMEYGNYCSAKPTDPEDPEEPTGIAGGKEPVVLSLFPNPFSSEATLQTGRMLNSATLNISNALGQQVYVRKNISGNKITISRNGLPAGLYYFRLNQDNATIATGKLVIAD